MALKSFEDAIGELSGYMEDYPTMTNEQLLMKHGVPPDQFMKLALMFKTFKEMIGEKEITTHTVMDLLSCGILIGQKMREERGPTVED